MSFGFESLCTILNHMWQYLNAVLDLWFDLNRSMAMHNVTAAKSCIFGALSERKISWECYR
jgi:hypothetical protein